MEKVELVRKLYGRDRAGKCETRTLPVAINPDCDRYLLARVLLLNQQLATVNRLALANRLPDSIITDTGLKITPQEAVVPGSEQALIDQASALLPRIKITELLMEVDDWTGFTRHFTHLKSGEQAQDRTLLLSTILADAINLGLTKMAESCPGATYSKLSWLQAWHIRDETYSAGLADLVNAQLRHPFAANWGDGSTSSSDGQRFRAGGRAESTGNINPKYGAEPGKMIYTHIADNYAPFSTKMVNVGVRDSTYVLDGLLYHESDLRIEEHYRHGRLHRPRVRADAHARVSLRAAHPRSGRHEVVHSGRHRGLSRLEIHDRRHLKHQTPAPALGRNSSTGVIY